MRFIGSFLILVTFLFGVDAFTSKDSVVMGERVILVISAQGKDIKFPEISKVSGFEVTSTEIQQNIEYSNGIMKKILEKHYIFVPLKSIDITPYEVEVDGKKEFTKSLHVEVKKVDYTNGPFTLEMKVKKQDVMQFEAVPIEFIFRRDRDYTIRDLRFSAPKFASFWVKNGKKSKPYLDNKFIAQKMQFFIFPQKSGDFNISPARVDVGIMSKTKDAFNVLSNQLNWKTVFSNTVPLHVNKLVGTNLYGDFYISLHVDKKNIEQNEGINVTLKITGSGNFDDIEDYKLDINRVNVYSDKPVVKSKAKVENLQGEFTQKFSLASSQNFTIPSLSITYYGAKEKKLVTKTTTPIRIYVKSAPSEKLLQISTIKPDIIKKTMNNYLYIFLAFIFGVGLTLVVIFLRKKQNYKLPRFKNDRDHLKSLLLRRGESEEIDNQIVKIEDKLYKKRL